MIVIEIITFLPTKHSLTLRDANEGVDKVCIEVQKTSNNAGGKPTRGFSFNIRHLVL